MIPAKFEADMLQKKYPELNVYVNTGNVLTANFASKALQLTIGTFSGGFNKRTSENGNAGCKSCYPIRAF